MVLRDWLHRVCPALVGGSSSSAIFVWRLHHASDATQAACSFTEPEPGVFQVVVTCNGTAEVRRVLNGLDMLMWWAAELRARLEADGWRERPLAEFEASHQPGGKTPTPASKTARQRIAAGERRPRR
jgi:hypothetical protein